MAKRRQNFQPITWFWDYYKRGLLNMNPPYQRRSVWTQDYRDQFIDTLMLDYPSPAIFLFQKIDEGGASRYELVDGKQRLTTVFSFVGNEFPVSEKCPLESLRGRFFQSLPEENRIAFWEYDFPVEYLPTNNEAVINNIFERINRNTMKLSSQELRHAKFSGAFITRAEHLAEWMESRFERPFPRITGKSKRQMKEVEVVASLLLFLEEGPKAYSADALDEAFANRDDEWEKGNEITEQFRSVIQYLAGLVNHPDGQFVAKSRFQNQADFYSFFGAIAELRREGSLPDDLALIASRLEEFLGILESDTERLAWEDATNYYNAARSASNDPGPRKERIRVVKKVLKGEALEPYS